MSFLIIIKTNYDSNNLLYDPVNSFMKFKLILILWEVSILLPRNDLEFFYPKVTGIEKKERKILREKYMASLV